VAETVTLADQIENFLPPSVTARIEKKLGLEEQALRQGLAVVLPLLTAALAGRSATPEGVVAVSGLVKNADEGVLANLSGYVDRPSKGTDRETARAVLGEGFTAVLSSLSLATGRDLAPLLALATPLLLSLLGNIARRRSLDSAGVARLLQREAQDFAAAGGAEATIVRDAVAAGESQAALKARFTPDEWQTLIRAPIAGAALVVGASPSGASGTAKEIDALVQTVRRAADQAAAAGLLRALFAERIADEARERLEGAARAAKGPPLPELTAGLLQAVKSAVEVVSTKADPVDAAAYKQLVMEAVRAVAAAEKEGGFMGVGGTQVSPEEQQTVDQLAALVGV
jgi:Bacterial protein of unknown function (DUF937)